MTRVWSCAPAYAAHVIVQRRSGPAPVQAPTGPGLSSPACGKHSRPDETRLVPGDPPSDEASEPTVSNIRILHRVEWRCHPGCFRTKATPGDVAPTVLVRPPWGH